MRLALLPLFHTLLPVLVRPASVSLNSTALPPSSSLDLLVRHPVDLRTASVAFWPYALLGLTCPGGSFSLSAPSPSSSSSASFSSAPLASLCAFRDVAGAQACWIALDAAQLADSKSVAASLLKVLTVGRGRTTVYAATRRRGWVLEVEMYVPKKDLELAKEDEVELPCLPPVQPTSQYAELGFLAFAAVCGRITSTKHSLYRLLSSFPLRLASTLSALPTAAFSLALLFLPLVGGYYTLLGVRQVRERQRGGKRARGGRRRKGGRDTVRVRYVQ
ncbi:hypothetical protein JCM8097_003192 [Rhodosporidiobolus ruineniae]